MADLDPSGLSDGTFLGLEELILSIARQDKEALRLLYCRHRRSIFAVAYALTRDRQLSEDVLQDTVIRIWENASGYRPGSNARAWIAAIAHNRCIDLIRQQKRTFSMELLEGQRLPEQLTHRSNPDDRLMLEAGLDQLDQEQAIIFVLKDLAGLSHLEIARQLGLSYRQVRYRYSKALAKLRKYLAGSI